jgi:urea transport system ATP-binding protein
MNTIAETRVKSLLYLENVSVSFDGFKALNSLSFVVEPGEPSSARTEPARPR